ncbi:MAG: tryptophan--tRNA ligase [Nitrospirae bacterium]|nr:tryptophan--tRNA ligase [Nitrospirota bacterium]
MKGRVLSGMQPSGKLHLGNLFGALQNWVRLQEEYDCFYFIADWHALTSNYADVSEIRSNIRDILIDWLAAGLDPKKSTIFIQSRLPEHAELHLLLSMITPLPWLERVPTYKEKQEEIKDRDLCTYGFLGYPVLQAADILIYRAGYVPVGVDQLPHLEITREIARRFNNFYGQIFPEPQALLTEYPKIIGIDGRKMSKSYGNAIFLSDSPEEVERKMKIMITDPARARRTDPGNPDVCPLQSLHKVFGKKDDIERIDRDCRDASIGCTDHKNLLIKEALAILKPFSEKRKELEARPDQLDKVIASGIKKAKAVASETMAMVREAMKI